MINYKYWKLAIEKVNYNAKTLVIDYYFIHKKEDFDIYFFELIPKYLSFNKKINNSILGPFFAFLFILKNASVLNTSFLSGALYNTMFWRLELLIYKFYGIKILISGYGGDFYVYSKVIDKSLTHSLLMSYKEPSRHERTIQARIDFLINKADIILNGIQLDGIGRWDMLPVSFITLENSMIGNLKSKKSDIITIVHSPNHRGFKGTEFIIKAIEELKREGFKINFKLLEKLPNDKVLKILNEEADILVEQIIFTGYALSGIEGMASGIPVLSSLENENYTKPLRRYSYLNECPILSTSPENIKDNLKLLILNEQLREELGCLGIEYVKKYHSEKSAQYLFGKIYNQLLNNIDEDLINMYHPLKSEYVKKNYIKTPLSNNCYVNEKTN